MQNWPGEKRVRTVLLYLLFIEGVSNEKLKQLKAGTRFSRRYTYVNEDEIDN